MCWHGLRISKGGVGYNNKKGESMNGRVWLNYFFESCKYLEEQSDCEGEAWTEFMGRILDVIGDKMNCVVVRSRQKSTKKDPSGEYLDVDAFYFDKSDYDLPIGIGDDEDPFVLPSAVVELENSFEFNKIAYCLWKILCVRAPIRALICYQKGMDAVTSLVRHLEDIIWQRGLLKGDNGNLFIIVGNDKKGDSEWEDYFSVFEWCNDRWAKIEALEW
jgi:hypothetical protein